MCNNCKNIFWGCTGANLRQCQLDHFGNTPTSFTSFLLIGSVVCHYFPFPYNRSIDGPCSVRSPPPLNSLDPFLPAPCIQHSYIAVSCMIAKFLVTTAVAMAISHLTGCCTIVHNRQHSLTQHLSQPPHLKSSPFSPKPMPGRQSQPSGLEIIT